MTTQFVPTSLTQVVGEASVVATFNPTWTTVPAVCNLTYLTRIKKVNRSEDPDLIVFQDVTLPGVLLEVTAGTDTIFYNGDHLTGRYNPSVYIVEVRAWADNSYDTLVFLDLTVIIVDPCVTATLTIDDTVFKPLPTVSLTQFVTYAPLFI